MMLKRNKLLTILGSFLAMVCVSLVGVFTVKASAATVEETNPTTFAMVDGASVRQDEYAGIRFTTVVAASYDGEDKTFGTIVAPKNILDAANITAGTFTHATAEDASVVIKDIPVSVWDTSKGTADKKVYNAVLWNIPASDYATGIVARSYVLEDGVYTYTENTVTRSCAQVAAYALADGVADSAQGTLVKYVDSVAESVALDKEEVDLVVGETITLTATTAPAGFPVVWKSSNEDVLTIKNGVVTAVADGEATITVSFGSKSTQCTVTVVNEMTVNLDEVNGFIKPVIEAGRMIDSNRAIKADANLAFDMSVFGDRVDNYTAKTLTIGGVEFASEQSAKEGATFKYAPNALISALKATTFAYGDNKKAEIVFVNESNGIINAQFSVDVVALLIKNADDLDHMMVAAQGLAYAEYDNYGGVNGSTGNALGVYKLMNNIYYKEGNADRKYSSEYFTRVVPSSAQNANNRFPKAIKNGQYGGFQGTFEGNGYTIYDLEFAEESTGLFGMIGQNASIKRISFVNLVHSGWYGVFAAIQQGGVIQDIYMQVSMTAKMDNQIPSKNIFLTAEEIAADSSLSGLSAISTGAQAQFRASAAIVSYVFKNSEALRVLVEYKKFVTSDTTVNGRRGSLYAYTDISATGQSKLTNLCAIGTPSQWVRLAPLNNTYYFVNSDPGLYATYDALKASGKDYSGWKSTAKNNFWNIEDGVPVPVNLEFRESDLTAIN